MELRRPSSDDELESLQRYAWVLARQLKYAEALALCDWLIEDPWSMVTGFRERAAVRQQMDNIAGAIGDLQAVTSRYDQEPGDFHALGLLLLQQGATLEAIRAFDQAIGLGEYSGHHYYRNSSLLFRADAHLKAADFARALADAARLPDDYQAFLPGSGMRSKALLLAGARAGLAHKSALMFLRRP